MRATYCSHTSRSEAILCHASLNPFAWISFQTCHHVRWKFDDMRPLENPRFASNFATKPKDLLLLIRQFLFSRLSFSRLILPDLLPLAVRSMLPTPGSYDTESLRLPHLELTVRANTILLPQYLEDTTRDEIESRKHNKHRELPTKVRTDDQFIIFNLRSDEDKLGDQFRREWRSTSKSPTQKANSANQKKKEYRSEIKSVLHIKKVGKTSPFWMIWIW